MNTNLPNSVLVRRPNDVLEHALLSAWLEASDIGLCVLDDKSKAVMLNKAACALLQVDGLASLNMPLRTLLKSVDLKPSVLSQIEMAGYDGEKQATCTTTVGKQHLLLKFRSVRVGTGPRFKMLSITDITAALAAEEKEAQRRQWQAMNAGVVITDARSPDMPVVYVNTFFENMSGYNSADMVGRNCRHLQGQDNDQPGVAPIREAIRNQTNGYAVLRNYRKDGSLFLNELFISPIKNEAGEVTHFMGIQHLRDANFNVSAMANSL
jgi:PAS domain S-box-containing protein